MQFDFDSDQRSLADAVGEVLRAEWPPSLMREAWSTPGAFAMVWRHLGELGLLGALVSESQGGLGLELVDVVLCFERLGRAAMPAPVAETVAVAAPLLATAGRQDELDAVISGRAPATAVLDGSALVPYVPGAVMAIVGDPHQARLVLDPTQGAEHLEAVDRARPVARLGTEAGQPLTGDAELIGAVSAAATVAIAAELVGLASAMIDKSVDYVRNRYQFDVPVGSFQAVKHRLADAKLAVEKARPMVYAAAFAVGNDPDSARVHVPAAKAMASDAAGNAARAALQCHGAIGYTIEHDLHMWMKRAWALAASWGDAREHRRHLGDQLIFDTTRGAFG